MVSSVYSPMKPQHIALLCMLVPFFAVHLTWGLSASKGWIPSCIPYLEGCTTISRAARSGESIHLFRAMMLPMATLFIFYWLQAHTWLRLITGQSGKGVFTMRALGVVGALFLILYATYLGTDGETYRWLRRYGVTFYFSFTALAQIFFIHSLHKQPVQVGSYGLQRILLLKTGLCVFQWGIGLISVPLDFLIETREARKMMQNIIEWNFALAMNLFFLLTYLMYKKTRYIHTGQLKPAEN